MYEHCGCCNTTLPIKDLTGQTFGNWIVLKYTGKSRFKCRCTCGTEKDVCSRELKNGDSKSCGCAGNGKIVKDLSGLIFGKLTVQKQDGYNKHRNAVWICSCSCGNITTVASGSLIKGYIRSCGCAKLEMLAARTPEQLYERCIKGAKKANKASIKYHWKTGQELVCRGSWEPKVIDYWNLNKIDFDWQVPIKLKNKLYIVDAYLPNENLWVEIKGYARALFIEKWEEFIRNHPNSEIWDKSKLRDLGIL